MAIFVLAVTKFSIVFTRICFLTMVTIEISCYCYCLCRSIRAFFKKSSVGVGAYWTNCSELEMVDLKMRDVCTRVWWTFPGKFFEFLSLSDLIFCILGDTYWQNYLSGVKFVERRSLTWLICWYIHSKGTFTGERKLSCHWWAEEVGGVKAPPVISFKKALFFITPWG